MHRRNFLTALFTALAGLLWPWGKAKATGWVGGVDTALGKDKTVVSAWSHGIRHRLVPFEDVEWKPIWVPGVRVVHGRLIPLWRTQEEIDLLRARARLSPPDRPPG